jgi:hypothetical protein
MLRGGDGGIGESASISPKLSVWPVATNAAAQTDAQNAVAAGSIATARAHGFEYRPEVGFHITAEPPAQTIPADVIVSAKRPPNLDRTVGFAAA